MNNTDEIWKTISIYGKDTSYMISSKGNVKNEITDKILKNRTKSGYVHVRLKTDAGDRDFNVALLMMKFFKNKTKEIEDDKYLYFYDGNRYNLDINNIDLLTVNEIINLENAKIFKQTKDGYVLRNGNELNEIWRQIVFGGKSFHYMISSTGRVMNILTGLFIKPESTPKQPYYSVSLSYYGGCTRYSVHRLVATMFIPNPDPNKYTVVNHLNEIKTDNRVENLEWTTISGNSKYSIESGTNDIRGESSMFSVIDEATVRKICELISSGYRPTEIANTLGTTRAIVSNIKNGRTWRHISSEYDFSSSFNSFITKEDAENIIQLREDGKTYDEIHDITGRSRSTIVKVLKDNNKWTGKKQKVVTSEVRSKTTWSIILLHEHGLSISEISEVLGVTKSKIENTLCMI